MKPKFLLRIATLAAAISGVLSPLSATHAVAKTQPLEITIAYGQYQPPKPPALSNILPEPDDAGLLGARLGIKDNNTTGRFLKQNYHLHEMSSNSPEALLAQAQAAYESGLRLFVFNTNRETLTELTRTLGKDAVIFNAGSYDDALRATHCQTNLLHSLPSRAMLADALGQWLTVRRWNKWLVIRGNQPEDLAYTHALHRAAKRFGHKIVEEKVWSFDTDLRRVAQKEVPLFTQTDEYDVVVVADENGDFGEYILFNTWLPRPVVGTQGLSPVTWHRVVEQWGAAQLQSRFEKLSNRWMTNKDYAAWAAVRSLAEAVTRTKTNSPDTLLNYIYSDDFQLAGFKGRKLNYRQWNGQLRQPIPLVHPRALASQSPQDGFLHPVTELDTLGYDAPEVNCTRIQ